MRRWRLCAGRCRTAGSLSGEWVRRGFVELGGQKPRRALHHAVAAGALAVLHHGRVSSSNRPAVGTQRPWDVSQGELAGGTAEARVRLRALSQAGVACGATRGAACSDIVTIRVLSSLPAMLHWRHVLPSLSHRPILPPGAAGAAAARSRCGCGWALYATVRRCAGRCVPPTTAHEAPMTIPLSLSAQIPRLHEVEHWRARTIARQLHVHRDTAGCSPRAGCRHPARHCLRCASMRFGRSSRRRWPSARR